ncbi:baseplate assembly protein [Ralstonia phage PQ43W]
MSDPKYASPFEAQFDPDRAQLFVIEKLLRGVHTVKLVKVLKVKPVSGKVGFVDVQPLVLDVDTRGVVIQQSPAYNLPYLRYQGGSSAVILDPVMGDIGIALFCDRDISIVKANAAPAAAGSARAHSSADGLYIGGVLNPDATQFVQFQPSGAGINITTPGNLNLTAGGTIHLQSTGTTTIDGAALVINAPTTFNNTISGTKTGTGNYSFASPITAPDFVAPNANLNTHTHTDPQGGNVGPPHN